MGETAAVATGAAALCGVVAVAAGRCGSVGGGASSSNKPETKPTAKVAAKAAGSKAKRFHFGRDLAAGGCATGSSAMGADGALGAVLGCPGNSHAGSDAMAFRTPSIQASPPGTVNGGNAAKPRSSTQGKLRKAAPSTRSCITGKVPGKSGQNSAAVRARRKRASALGVALGAMSISATPTVGWANA